MQIASAAATKTLHHLPIILHLLTHCNSLNRLKEKRMYSYGLLEPGCYYLIQEQEDSPIMLIRVAMESDHCMYVFEYNDELTTVWKRKLDRIYDIIECLTDEAVEAWERHYNSNNEDAYYEDEE